MPAIYDRAAKDLAALDFTAENETIVRHAAEGEKLTAAILKAESRISELQGQLSAILQDRMAEKKAAVAVADALLGEADASQAAATVVKERDLREEIASLRAGLGELRDRSRDNSDQVAWIKSDALRKIVPAVQPVADALIADVRAAADTIGRAYASLAAMAGATRHFHDEARQVGDSLARLMATSLIARRDVLDTPDAIAEMLAPLATKGPAASIHVPTHAGVPDDRSATGLIAGMVARQIG
jgi:chromosome segregation ATPase